jgi:hypothetical protein
LELLRKKVKYNKKIFSQPNLLHTDLQNKKDKIDKINKINKNKEKYLFYYLLNFGAPEKINKK